MTAVEETLCVASADRIATIYVDACAAFPRLAQLRPEWKRRTLVNRLRRSLERGLRRDPEQLQAFACLSAQADAIDEHHMRTIADIVGREHVAALTIWLYRRLTQ